MSKLLISEPPLQVLPSLAVAIGLNEAIVLQQLHYWLMNPKAGFERDGHKWIENTYDQWRENFPFWSAVTIKRAFSNLEKGGYVKSCKIGKGNWDQSKAYRIEYSTLETDQNDPINEIKMIPSNGSSWTVHIKEAETTSETTSKITPLSPKGDAVDLDALVSSEFPALVQHLPAIREWLAYKREKKQSYKPLGLTSLLRTLAAMPNPTQAIHNSMAMNYSGVYEKSSGGGESNARAGSAPKALRAPTAEQLERMHR